MIIRYYYIIISLYYYIIILLYYYIIILSYYHARMHFALTHAGPEQQAEVTVEVPVRREGQHVRCRHSNW